MVDVGLWDVATGHKTATLAEGSPVTSVAFGPGGHAVAAGDGVVTSACGTWPPGDRPSNVAEGSPVTSIAFGPGGRILAVGDGGGDVGLWDVAYRAEDSHPAGGQPGRERRVQPGRADPGGGGRGW